MHIDDIAATSTTDALADLFDQWIEAKLPTAAKDVLPDNGRMSADELWHELQGMIDDQSRAELQPLCDWLMAYWQRWEVVQDEEDFEQACAARGEK